VASFVVDRDGLLKMAAIYEVFIIYKGCSLPDGEDYCLRDVDVSLASNFTMGTLRGTKHFRGSVFLEL